MGQFISVVDGLAHKNKEIPREVILEGLGIKPNWLPTLEKAIKGSAEVVSKQGVSLCGFQVKKSHWPYYLAAGGIVLIGFLAARFFRPRYS